jgi:coproporphyrinogen III oxidase
MMINHLQHSQAVLGLCTAVLFAGPAFAERNDGIEGLNEAQQAFAGRFLQFQDEMDEKFFSRAGEINGGHSSDVSETIEEERADFYVRVARGDVVEKIGRMISRVYEPSSDIQRPTTFSRYYGLDVHAKSPLMGHIHTAIVLQYYPDGIGIMGGTLNLLKGAAREEDLEYVKNALDVVFEKHGVDSAPYRNRVCNMSEEAVQPKYHRKLACVGAGFFGFPLMEANEENFLFMAEIYAAFISSYMDTLEGRKDAPYTDEDVAKQEAMRLNWTEDQFLGDPYSSGGVVPYGVWGHAFLPPLVKF